MSDISANNIDRKLIIVSMSMFSGSRNSNMAIILCQPLFFFNMAATCLTRFNKIAIQGTPQMAVD